MNVLILSQLILNVPWLLRLFAPFTFLIGPLMYVYIRSTLNNELEFKKYDWLLLIPAILVLLNFIPFYILSNPEKINYLNENFFNKVSGKDSGKGFIPPILYNIIRVCWSGIFIFYGFKMIYQFRKKFTKEIVSKNRTLLNWLATFNSLLTAIFIILILKFFVHPFINTQTSIADILLGATILYICLNLFMKPQILYGVFLPLNINTKVENRQLVLDIVQYQNFSELVSKSDFSDKIVLENSTLNSEQAQQFRYKNTIETYFSKKNQFLQSDYSLGHLVLDTQIPRHILSAFINQEYGMGFREFLNRKKVEFLIANHNKPEWKQFTLEAIASECGYNSRTTFIKNFKEITGKTPSEFFKTAENK